MICRHLCQTIVAVALIFAAAIVIDARAVEHEYTATWDANPPDEQIEDYRLRAWTADGEVYTGTSTETTHQFSLDLSLGETLNVVVQACRNNGQNCSEDSVPATISVPPADVTTPVNVRIER